MMTDPQPFTVHTHELAQRVNISMLGSFELNLAGNQVPIVHGSKSEHLLVCLTLARQRRMLRVHLLERIWPQVDPLLAGQSLNSLTHQLNKMTCRFLNGDGIILHENGHYQLNLSGGVWTDIDYFNTWSEKGKYWLDNNDSEHGVALCEQALALYQGDLCGDSSIQTIMEREELRAKFLTLLARLADHYNNLGNPSVALHYIQRLLAHDPCREDAHRHAMHCYVQLNQRSQALRQYRICCKALELEFDAQPEPATVALFDQIRLHPAPL